MKREKSEDRTSPFLQKGKVRRKEKSSSPCARSPHPLDASAESGSGVEAHRGELSSHSRSNTPDISTVHLHNKTSLSRKSSGTTLSSPENTGQCFAPEWLNTHQVMRSLHLP
ncbi:hypothetical protein NQD34_000692 [Periophthalmus magnuspinnatus]|nr:hypothetical protein NQD34_000692 [Periophthalmus magnuspinnatus]